MCYHYEELKDLYKLKFYHELQEKVDNIYTQNSKTFVFDGAVLENKSTVALFSTETCSVIQHIQNHFRISWIKPVLLSSKIMQICMKTQDTSASETSVKDYYCY